MQHSTLIGQYQAIVKPSLDGQQNTNPVYIILVYAGEKRIHTIRPTKGRGYAFFSAVRIANSLTIEKCLEYEKAN